MSIFKFLTFRTKRILSHEYGHTIFYNFFKILQIIAKLLFILIIEKYYQKLENILKNRNKRSEKRSILQLKRHYLIHCG